MREIYSKGGIFTALKEPKYKRNQTILKVFDNGTDKKIKVITMNALLTSGLEIEREYSEKGSVNDKKLADNITRAKSKIFELAFCNKWDYFFTGTIDGNKYDRTDLEKYHKDLSQFIRDKSKKYNSKIDYLFIPELHSDGVSWHIHGFIKGLPREALTQFCVGDVMGKALAEKVKNGDTVYNWNEYSKKFGFCDLEPIKHFEAVSKYITKYINKNLADSVTELNAHLYYHSQGLNTAQTIKKGTMLADIAPDFMNEYCSVSWLPYSDELLEALQNSFVDIDYYTTRSWKMSTDDTSPSFLDEDEGSMPW